MQNYCLTTDTSANPIYDPAGTTPFLYTTGTGIGSPALYYAPCTPALSPATEFLIQFSLLTALFVLVFKSVNYFIHRLS